jgi:hypothetical protein
VLCCALFCKHVQRCLSCDVNCRSLVLGMNMMLATQPVDANISTSCHEIFE